MFYIIIEPEKAEVTNSPHTELKTEKSPKEPSKIVK